MGKVHHIRGISACGTHVYLKADEVTLFADAFLVRFETEEFQMHEASVGAESLYCSPARPAETFRNVTRDIVHELQLIIHDIHDRGRPAGHRLEQRLAGRGCDCVVGKKLTVDEFFHEVLDVAGLFKERGKLFLVPYFVSVRRADTDVRLDNDGITDFCYEAERILECRCQMALGARNMRVGIELLHCGFVLEIVDPVGSYAGRHIEIRAETGVLQRLDLVVFGQGSLKLAAQVVIRCVADTEDTHTVSL